MALLVAALVWAGTAVAADEPPLKVGFRCDAPPFSHLASDNGNCSGNGPWYESDFRGYIADVCRSIFREMRRSITVRAVTAGSRFDLLRRGEIDVLCDPTTITGERLEEFAFSPIVFISGVSYLFAPGRRSGRAVPIVGYLEETTADRAVMAMTEQQVFGVTSIEKLPFQNHFAGVAALCAGNIDFYVADRDVLISILKTQAARGKCDVAASRSFYSYEPYAITVSARQPDLAAAVERAFYMVAMRQEITAALQEHFGLNNVSDLVRGLIRIYERVPR